MTVCTDVYTRPQSCGVISIYPSQVHPSGGGARPSGPNVRHGRHRIEDKRLLDDDDEAIAAALLLLL